MGAPVCTTKVCCARSLKFATHQTPLPPPPPPPEPDDGAGPHSAFFLTRTRIAAPARGAGGDRFIVDAGGRASLR